MNVFLGIMLPFFGTTLGAACVFFVKSALNERVQKFLLGFASGVMVAASIWSLLIPAMELSEHLGKWKFVPAFMGLLFGVVFLLFLERIIPHAPLNPDMRKGSKQNLKKTTMLMLAVTLHNVPEGMAVGVVFAGMLTENVSITLAGAMALSMGIAIQNFPEGAIISLPLKSNGSSRKKAFWWGVLSGLVEPVAAVLSILLVGIMEPVLPVVLSFAAGAMLYVVVEELIPEASLGEHSDLGTIGFVIGFSIMMILDVALG